MPESTPSAGRTISIESIVIQWIEMETPAPASLRRIVQRYRDLTWFRDTAADPAPLDRQMDQIYDYLLEHAESFPPMRHMVDPQKQLRRLERRDEARMTWMQRCSKEIERWRAARGCCG
jgi:hypothetical protein